MQTMIETNWPVFAAVLALALLVAWLLWRRSRVDRRQRHHAPDALDEGVGPARRNQALIDAPSAAAQATLAATLADSGPATTMSGIGEVIAAAAPETIVSEPIMADPVVQVTAPVAGDDLTRIKGLGPKLKARLAELGVTRFAQIAAWTDADIARIDGQLGTFAGRATRDQWVAQAGFLASGDVAGYEAKFGKI